ncbi:hypothetical protein M3212_00145 [Alkalihalobacillus oceani]|nr:hypothetical protein [Halalkalibacter oceani]MCM3759190.1 hypothetical protein [Halalkalibacter oceani]
MGLSLTLISSGLIIGYINYEYTGALIGLFAALLIGMLFNSRKQTN